MSEVLLLLFVVTLVLYWLSAMHAKDFAIMSARRECKLCDVQFLDQTVQLAKISVSRDESGQWRLWREYKFEYTDDGDSRRRGRLTLLGQRVMRITMETFNPVIH